MTTQSKVVKEPLNTQQRKVFWGMFSIIFLVNVISNFMDNRLLIIFSKPLLMPFIAIYFSATWKETSENSIIYKSLMIGFFFAWIGDIYMMFRQEEEIMLLGLSSFFICHVLYIVAFFFSGVKDKPAWFLLSFVLSLFGGFIGEHIVSHNSMMFAPVLAYSIIISVMFSFAFTRIFIRKDKWAAFTAVGALLFIISDIMIGLSHFQGMEISHAYIMITYIIAQLLISRGMMVEGVK
ncbi:lysoplasmalogenase [Flammeovirga sp. SubArs3]|uniref:lysoplasmalogenase n=1 Tax=Flammeovirga sp. SubArs3 TaxID=2995316 RepID=UPI00248B0A76|nr:lysoplasmalogenase [Flammeovirga sp. SubArs3]